MVRRNSRTRNCGENQNDQNEVSGGARGKTFGTSSRLTSKPRLRRRSARDHHHQQSSSSHQAGAVADIYSTQAPSSGPRFGPRQQASTTLLAPHFFLPGSSGSFVLAGLNNSSALGAGHLLPLLGGLSSAQPSGQFASLTPDARACVTATYLCVLIVNNTWLDCNLLDTLCNTSSSRATGPGSGSASKAAGANGDERDDSILRDARNATKWLAGERRDEFQAERALESALSGLVAFAGGHEGPHPLEESDEKGAASFRIGRLQLASEAGGEETAGPGVSERQLLVRLKQQRQQVEDGQEKDRIYLVPIQLAHPSEPDKSRQIPLILHDRGGSEDESVSDSLGPDSSSFVASQPAAGSQPMSSTQAEINDSLGAWQHYHATSDLAPKSAGASADDERDKKLLEQYSRLRKFRSEISDESDAEEANGAPDMNVSILRSADSIANVSALSAPDFLAATHSTPTTSSTTPVPANQNPLSIVSLVGRPFRGWSSYAFWSSAPSSDQASPMMNQVETGSSAELLSVAHRQQTGVQVLRPYDRGEQFNDILTSGQSKNKAPSRQATDGDEERAHPLQADTFLEASQQAQSDQMKHQQRRQQQQKQQQAVPLPSQIFSQDYPPSSEYSVGLPANPLVDSNSGQLLTTPATAGNIASLYDYNSQRSKFTQAQQQQMFGTTSSPLASHQQFLCNCDHVISDECRLHCLKQQASNMANVPVAAPKQQQQQQQQSSANDNQMVASGSSYANPHASPHMSTAPTTLSPPTLSTSSPIGGKMNPLDVSFSLYTRYNRELASDLAQARAAGPQAGLVAPAPVSAATSSVSTTSMTMSGLHNCESLISGSDIIDLTNETSLSEAQLNSSLPFKIIIHGFGSGGRRPWVTDMVNKLLDYEDANVIVVDWEKGAVLPNYVQAAGNTRIVGHRIACLIKTINSKYGLTGARYHLIGFSLGAHVAGFAGMEIRNSSFKAHQQIARITGLDPASPLFEGYEANDRLDPTDAQFVDVIHSNGDGVLRGGFGSLQPMGHVDFYPNGGRVQVGCNSVLLSALSDIIYGKWQSLCNHRRALNFFMDSFEFNKCRFRSFSCDSYENYLKGECFDCGHNNEKCSYMGYLANYSEGRGKMYLTTHEEAPFCANQFIIKIIGSKGYKTHWGKVEVTLVTADGKNESFWLSSMHNGQTTAGALTASSSSTSLSSSMSSHESGANHKELSQQSMQSLIVAHPTLMNFTQILLRYTKYKGWIYSGDENWPIDKVFITDSDGQVKSFCGHNTILESHIISRLSLEPGNCTVLDSQPATSGGSSSLSKTGEGTMQSSPMSRVSMAGSAGNGPSQTSGQQMAPMGQQSPRTPRLLSSLLQYQSSNTGTNSEVHQHQQHQQQQQQQQANQAPLFISNGHKAIMQRMLTPHTQFPHQILSF